MRIGLRRADFGGRRFDRRGFDRRSVRRSVDQRGLDRRDVDNGRRGGPGLVLRSRRGVGRRLGCAALGRRIGRRLRLRAGNGGGQFLDAVCALGRLAGVGLLAAEKTEHETEDGGMRENPYMLAPASLRPR
nr:hypothetical protein [Lysobacter enzymogenes]